MKRNRFVSDGKRRYVPPADLDDRPLSHFRRRLLWIWIVIAALAIAAIHVVPAGLFDLEEWLRLRFPAARPDAFEFVNRFTAPPFTIVILVWLAMTVGFGLANRYASLAVLAFGPVIAAVFVVSFTDFSDPAWYTIGAVVAIGCIVGIGVSVSWDVFGRARRGRK